MPRPEQIFRIFFSDFTATPELIYNFLSDIAAGKESLAHVEKWIATNLAKPRKE